MTIKFILFITLLFSSFIFMTRPVAAPISSSCPAVQEAVKMEPVHQEEEVVVEKKQIIEYTPIVDHWRPDPDLTAFIKSIENHPLANGKTKLVAYKDYGYIAKGYGTRSKHFKVNTLQEAEKIMFIHLIETNKVIDRYVIIELTQHQRNALVSLVYNIGPYAFKTSVALKALNKGNISEFKIQAFHPRKGFVLAGGKHNKGLKKRRAHELQIWDYGKYYTMLL